MASWSAGIIGMVNIPRSRTSSTSLIRRLYRSSVENFLSTPWRTRRIGAVACTYCIERKPTINERQQKTTLFVSPSVSILILMDHRCRRADDVGIAVGLGYLLCVFVTIGVHTSQLMLLAAISFRKFWVGYAIYTTLKFLMIGRPIGLWVQKI